ncbi:DUF7662 domain-containing protein [Paenibacillus roseipurpureus]|uniref:DUF7662 domain-containing protein n=1 Tax=Paenibacillus roseopurpureus TaxID=2918901 RepID=A0AA96LPX3_9BACL|nr:hypothetical protein [Paenibacillus sp. MBLB1832]WNR45121.1 hypothetical protein MJB10_02930 [Paenibacillus sp. MBLB1832]
MTSMYDPIRDELRKYKGESVTYTYVKLNELIKCRSPKKELPLSAHKRKIWWDNHESSGHTQMISWTSAGWLVDMKASKLGEYITFIKKSTLN